MLLADLVAASTAVGATRSRIRKREIIAGVLGSLANEEIRVAVSYLSGELPQGRIGLGYATVYGVDSPPAGAASLSISDVDELVGGISHIAGAGSHQRRREGLERLLQRATADEQQFLRALLLRELRQGARENSMAEAIAAVLDIETASVLRAVMLSGDLVTVAEAALTEGASALDEFALTLFRPIRPMLARTCESIQNGLARHSPAAIEAKLDGARVQVHNDSRRVEVYTRNLRRVTDQVPEVAETVRSWDVEQAVVDGEVIALDEDGTPLPFQVTMSRFGTRRNVSATRATVPLTTYLFDCLRIDGDDLVDAVGAVRWDAVEAVAEPGNLPMRIVTDDAAMAEAFYGEVIDAGHEGVMVKSLDAPYNAGRRGADWLKVKPAHTLDLVVIAVEWGSGRCRGWLSNLHLGARDPESGEFVMLGKTFKGLTDETLAWQTERFLDLETGRDGHVVFVRPEQVVEIAFDGVQASTRYPGGMALRFARVKGYRDDKGPDEADTIDAVRAVFQR